MVAEKSNNFRFVSRVIRCRCADCGKVWILKYNEELPKGHNWDGPEWDKVVLEKDGAATVLTCNS